MTNPTDPITLTREIVEELIVLLVDIGGTSAILDANASTDNIVRLLRALLAEPTEPPPPRDADGAADAITRHGITPETRWRSDTHVYRICDGVVQCRLLSQDDDDGWITSSKYGIIFFSAEQRGEVVRINPQPVTKSDNRRFAK